MQFQSIKVGVVALPALHEGWRALIWKRRIRVFSPDGWALLRANIASPPKEFDVSTIETDLAFTEFTISHEFYFLERRIEGDSRPAKVP